MPALFSHSSLSLCKTTCAVRGRETLSNASLREPELKILKKGPNFAPSHSCVPVSLFISSVKRSLSNLSQDDATVVRKCMCISGSFKSQASIFRLYYALLWRIWERGKIALSSQQIKARQLLSLTNLITMRRWWQCWVMVRLTRNFVKTQEDAQLLQLKKKRYKNYWSVWQIMHRCHHVVSRGYADAGRYTDSVWSSIWT